MNSRKGFTLVEVLIATSILVIIATMVFEAFAATLSAGKGLEADFVHKPSGQAGSVPVAAEGA